MPLVLHYNGTQGREEDSQGWTNKWVSFTSALVFGYTINNVITCTKLYG